MEMIKKKNDVEAGDKEIVFSKSIKAGKRIYYLDVKRNRKDELFLAITESKKVISGEGESSLVSFEKHKIFLYKEDFEKFVDGLKDTIEYINANQVVPSNGFVKDHTLSNGVKTEEISEAVQSEPLNEDIKIDIDFE